MALGLLSARAFSLQQCELVVALRGQFPVSQETPSLSFSVLVVVYLFVLFVVLTQTTKCNLALSSSEIAWCFGTKCPQHWGYSSAAGTEDTQLGTCPGIVLFE